MEDIELLKLIKASPSDGIKQVIQLYGGLVKAISIRVGIENPQDQEECISDTFTKLWQSIDKIDLSKGTLKSYLSIIGRNTAINKRKQLKRSEILIPIEENDCGIEIDMEQDIANEQNAKLINAVVSEMGEPDREIFIRRYFFFERIKEIATHLGLENKTVENKLYNGKKQLKSILLERGIILS
ncbi:sigma-70 family RNA polymerase sigma factor [Paludicola sp. MB14-C6]|uniref:RNA polymerase sigma factor n=1 Tax=Paludihabitans sp. MB14-C6 TaxID=3070656 RepID=UPI0027DB48AD|nr:sigma-70 family RNA polymerase sigma factor [Paludicola sp. MB14-C6]WMJ23811.1 sigma-70 family RNA polymerase sigma factor [Paludicola sp. MB14-C6]